MRSAVIMPWSVRLDVGSWDPYAGQDSCRFVEPGYVSPLAGPDTSTAIERLCSELKPFACKVSDVSWYCCDSVGPHTDESLGDYTLGVVYAGGGTLFTGTGRDVGVLRPGSVYFLNNKKLHGLKKAEGLATMVFAVVDFVSDRFEEMARFLMKQAVQLES